MRSDAGGIEAAMAAANPECHPSDELIDKDGTRLHASGTDTSAAGVEPSVDELAQRMLES